MSLLEELNVCIDMLQKDGYGTKHLVRDRLEQIARREECESKLTNEDIDVLLDVIDHNIVVFKKALTLNIDNASDVEKRIQDLERIGIKLRKVQKR